MTEYLYEETKALRAELKKAQERIEVLKVEKQWIIDRITAELKTEGIELQWTDGGGAACPSGWHRNPYINSGLKKNYDELKTIVIDLIKHREAGCGCDAHPPDACEWHGPLRRASRAVGYNGP